MSQIDQLLALLCEVCAAPQLLDAPDTDLLESNLLDSLAFIELLEGIEDHFGVTLEPTQIPRACFANARSIMAFIQEQQST